MIRLLTGYIEKAKDLQIGPSTLADIVANLFPVSKEEISQDLKKETDIGILASAYMKKYSKDKPQSPSPLEIKEILLTLAQVATTKGKGSKEAKLKLLLSLCKRCQNESELMFLLRILKVFAINYQKI